MLRRVMGVPGTGVWRLVDLFIELALDESKWLSSAMVLSFLAVTVLWVRTSGRLSERLRIQTAMHLFYGCLIGLMAFGHLLAVTIKAAQGTLSASLWVLYPLGLLLALPAGWLVFGVIREVADDPRWKKRAAALNAALGISLLALGPHNLPLAAPAGLNIAYQFHSRRTVGWAIATILVVGFTALFVGSLIFLASGRSFEDFSGM